jgi:hypothetical protein
MEKAQTKKKLNPCQLFHDFAAKLKIVHDGHKSIVVLFLH